ncbi:hypothetical protein BRCON_1898 [Candidatus Sumerlaea chitinivorans]|uniref:Uncharacterized protein n=1 Tax=Sumerlaea chitinivorans TaxID=2250252 RepID=A0A2Z4Y8B7_SUMC1|nr:hypothetical protein BRCON_1898 [Candidatus Sumerlaea chitinivorans]
MYPACNVAALGKVDLTAPALRAGRLHDDRAGVILLNGA